MQGYGTVGGISLWAMGVLSWYWPDWLFPLRTVSALSEADYSSLPMIPGFFQAWPSSFWLTPWNSHPNTTTPRHTCTYIQTHIHSSNMYAINILFLVDRVSFCCPPLHKTEQKNLNSQHAEQCKYCADTKLTTLFCQVHAYWTSEGWVWRRKWQPTPVFLPRESRGQKSLGGCCPWGHTESDTTEAT